MLWGAINNASTAMMAMSTDMGSISQNISNVNTTGYKRTETMFKTMMSEHHATPNSYVGGLNVFGVQAVQRNHIQAQGIITPSTTWSDLAINGSGFFMVAPPATTGAPSTVDLEDPDAVFYTRDGSWSRVAGPDTDPSLARSYFTTAGGNYLMGWMADDTGAINTAGTLQPVYTLAPRPIAGNGTPAVDETSTLTPSSILMAGRATTSISVMANIPSGAPLTSSTFSSTSAVVDPNTGLEHDVTLDWQRVDGNTWTVTPSIPTALGSVTSAPITVETDPYGAVYLPAAGDDTVTFSWASGPATNPLNILGTDYDNPTFSSTSSISDPNGASQTVNLLWTRVSGTVWDVTASVAPGVGMIGATTTRVTLDSSGGVITPADHKLSLTVDWDDATYGDETAAATSTIAMSLNGATPASDLDVPSTSLSKIPVEIFDDQFEGHEGALLFERAGSNTWYMHVQSGDGATPPEPVQLVFDGKGQLVSPVGTLSIPFEFVTDGVTTTSNVTVDLSKLTQFDGSSLHIGNVSTDGYGEGSLMATTFTETGELEGYYSNGRSRTLFKVPVANFVSDNALEAMSGNLFRRTPGAGDLTVAAIEDAPGEARFATSSLESSTTNIEDEFTRMIMTQKAYSTNATVFKTADEMTSTARDLKR